MNSQRLPLGWTQKTIGEICDVDPELLSSGTAADYEFNYIDIAAVQPNKISSSLSNERFRTAPSRARKKVRRDDVLMATVRPNLKAFAKVDRDGELVASTGFAVLRARKSESDSEYLKQILFSDSVEKQIEGLVAGSNYPAITVGNVRKLIVPVPPWEEQCRIAELLSTLDKEIEHTEALIHKSEKLLDGMLDSLLLQGLRSSTLGAFAEMRPKTLAPELKTFVPFVGMEAVSESGHIVKYQFRPWEEVSSGFTRFSGNDILIAKITPCFENGKGAIVPVSSEVWTGSTEFHILRAKHDVSARWLYWHTRTREFREKGAARMTGSAGQQRVPRTYVEQFAVEDIVLTEQIRRAKILDSVDDNLTGERHLLAKLILKKQGLMTDLLTGKVRLKDKKLGSNL